MLKQEKKPVIEYTAQAASPLVNGEAKLTIHDNALAVTALFDAAEIPFAEINALTLANYAVAVSADGGDYVFSRMGNWCQPFYDALRDAYDKAVLRSLFIKVNPILTAKGDYRYTEKGVSLSGSAPVHVYDNSVVVLPPNLGARRVPLCFVGGMDKGDYELTLKLDTGESYACARLGYDTAAFADAVEKQIRSLREKSLAAVRELDPSMTAIQASQIARLMPHGAAASFGRISAIAPSFAAALESKLAGTRAAESYGIFRRLCDPARICVGFRRNEAAGAAERLTGEMSAPPDGVETAPPSAAYLLWLIAPSQDGRFAAVEFAEADAATFVYRTDGDFDGFARQLNRALEAINFRREVIRLSDKELKTPENADYYMAAKRTAALQFVRLNFTGRIIHSDMGSWERKLAELWSNTVA